MADSGVSASDDDDDPQAPGERADSILAACDDNEIDHEEAVRRLLRVLVDASEMQVSLLFDVVEALELRTSAPGRKQ